MRATNPLPVVQAHVQMYKAAMCDPSNITGFYEIAKNPEGTETECYTRHFHVAKHEKVGQSFSSFGSIYPNLLFVIIQNFRPGCL